MQCRMVKCGAASIATTGWVAAASSAWFSGAQHLAWLLLTVGLAASCTAVWGISLFVPDPRHIQRAAYDAGWRDGRRAESLINGRAAQVIPLPRRESS